jgi:hypothetical protein
MGVVGAVMLTGLLGFSRAMFIHADDTKQYTSDVFWVVLLIGLAAWALDRDGRELRRIYVWWAVAITASWFSMGAVTASFALVLVMLVVVLRRLGWRTALRGALPGFAYLASFGLLYMLSLRHAMADEFLASFWRYAAPQHPITLERLVSWGGTRFESLALDPVGTRFIVLFWVFVALGWLAAARYRPYAAWLLITPVVIAWVLGAADIVPLIARLALWLAPALFLAVAAAAQAAAWWGADRGRALWNRPSWSDAASRTAAVTASAAVLAVGAALFLVPMYRASVQGPPRAQVEPDDRGAVAWIASQRRPGDLILTGFPHGFPIRWYQDPEALAPVKLVRNWKPGADCDPTEFAKELRGHKRVIFFVGLPVEKWFPQINKVVPARLAEFGTPVEFRKFSIAEVHIVDLEKGRAASAPDPVLASQPFNCLKVYPLDQPY